MSVAAVGRAFEPAVELLRDRPAPGRPDVGIHLTLVGERPLSPPERISSLVGRDGALLSGYPALARRFLAGGLALAEVEAELRLQIERLLATGLPVVHANAHQHLHVLPRIFEIVARLAEEHGIRFRPHPLRAGGRRLVLPRQSSSPCSTASGGGHGGACRPAV